MEHAEPIRRTLEIEELTNRYFVHPIAGWLVPLFAALRISPNAVSMAGMALGISAGVAYARYQDPRYVILGFILMIAWHVMDGADGQLARLTKSQSQLGKVLDGICDYVTFIAVYAGLASNLSVQYGDWVWLLILSAGLCHAVQSAAYEAQRQEYNFWGLGRKSAGLFEAAVSARGASRASFVQRLSDGIHRVYLEVQLLVSGVTVEFHDRLAKTLDLPPERAASVRRRYRETFAPLVRQWSVMSANYRTLGIFAFALAGLPLYYFWFEIIGFSAMSVLLLRKRRVRYEQFFSGLEPVDGRSVSLSMRPAE
ncbi:MAG TPA: CDP-alcohol phosphatidyltransferase family protein [Aliidongia sp.]|nr:CDP-alcohol phosphatidyltransferase family protein [Aliidongia sp.]